MPDLSKKVQALQLNLEAFLKLLGGSADDRERFWEILRGITTPAEFRLLSSQLDASTNLVKQLRVNAETVQASAKQISKTATAKTATAKTARAAR